MIVRTGGIRLAAMIGICVAVAYFTPFAAHAGRQVEPYKDARVEAAKILARTMNNPEFRVRGFRGGAWLGNGDYYLAIENSKETPGGTDIVRYATSTGARDIFIAASKMIPAGAKTPLTVEGYKISPDGKRVLIFTNSRTVWRQNTRGDYWVLDLSVKEVAQKDSENTDRVTVRLPGPALRRIGGDAPEASLMFAKFSPDNSKVGYVSRNNVYVQDLASGQITKLTHDGAENIINGTSDWVNEEEFDIRDGFQWSPDSKKIAFWQFNTTGMKNYTLIYDLSAPRGEIVTGIPYPDLGPYPQTMLYQYPLAGYPNSAVRVGTVNISSSNAGGGDVVWMQTSGDLHNFYIPRMDWADANHVLLQHMNRLQNRNEFLLADASTGVSRTILVDEDKAWVELNGEITWINSGHEFLMTSERDGWRHLYRVNRDTGAMKLVTHGNFDVVSLETITPDEQWAYFISSPDNATERFLFRTKLDGSAAAPERITPGIPGTHSYNISPNGEWAFHSFSSFDVPPTSEVVHLPDHKVARNTADNSSIGPKVLALSGGPVEYLRVDAGDGVMVDGWLIKPPNFDPAKKYPIIVLVYSEPASQTVADHWTAGFDRALTSAGYLVASFDNSGTPAPRGRDWRKVVYGNIGTLSSKQQATALQSLEKMHPYIDAKRVGVWGWSGGGTETLNLMFRYPDVYSVGVSVASVPDQRLYDTIYQERYLGLPQDSPKAYEQSSAINFAEGLRGSLLVMHGSGDDNVHFQGFELLVNKLISLGKQFDMRVYPQRTHGIFEGRGTSQDVYTNILGYFEEHLPPIAVSAGAH